MELGAESQIGLSFSLTVSQNFFLQAAYIINGNCKNVMNMSQSDQVELWRSVMNGTSVKQLRGTLLCMWYFYFPLYSRLFLFITCLELDFIDKLVNLYHSKKQKLIISTQIYEMNYIYF